MKIKLPETIKDITLGQFQEYTILSDKLTNEDISEVEFVKKKISLFSGIPYGDIKNVLTSDLESIAKQIDTALNQECAFESKFVLKGIEFGFVDNLNDIKPSSQYGLDDEKSGAYFDMTNYGSKTEALHQLMAILFRPIKSVDKFGNYKVKKYNGTAKYGELMKQMPLNIVNGCLVFFLNLSRELEIHILKSTAEAQAKVEKQVNTSSNGDGTVPSMN